MRNLCIQFLICDQEGLCSVANLLLFLQNLTTLSLIFPLFYYFHPIYKTNFLLPFGTILLS